MWRFFRRLGLVVKQARSDPAEIILVVESSALGAVCPFCGHFSDCRHSQYVRRLLDLPADSRKVVVHWRIRKFRCINPNCRHRVFAERIPGFARPHARRTERLDQLLTRIGVFLGGEAGARLARDLHTPVSPDTILRLLYRMEISPCGNVRVIGVDEWAWRKGRRYGTIVCDLETGRPVEILPEARAEVLANWLREHSSVTIVSRDRSGTFADGAKAGAPNAIQVADRWHLFKNLGDLAERVVSTLSLPPVPVEEDSQQALPVAETRQTKPAGENRKDARKRQSQQRRQERYDAIHALYAKTRSIHAVARELGVCLHTVRKYLRASECPQPKPRAKRKSILDPYRDYLIRRWSEGCQNAAALYREITELGYTGSQTLVKDFVATLRRRSHVEPLVRYRRLPAAKLRKLFTQPPEKLNETEHQWLELLLNASDAAREAYSFFQEFRALLTNRQADGLLAWLERAGRSSLEPIRGFAANLRRDLEAVIHALTLPWSNGPVEGHINRLKLLKRQMYGRAGIELLKRRFLAMAK